MIPKPKHAGIKPAATGDVRIVRSRGLYARVLRFWNTLRPV